jgi:DNA uptake protein ComE-like DNA-binding protein
VDISPDHDGADVAMPELPPAFFSIVVALGILLIWMGYGMMHRPAANAFSPAMAARFTQSGIDPNTASWASLVRIPGVGPGRAQKLLAWRKAHQANAGSIVFHSPADLRQVRSFGPKTIAEITPYLRFPVPPMPTHRINDVPQP